MCCNSTLPQPEKKREKIADKLVLIETERLFPLRSNKRQGITYLFPCFRALWGSFEGQKGAYLAVFWRFRGISRIIGGSSAIQFSAQGNPFHAEVYGNATATQHVLMHNNNRCINSA